MTRTWGWCGLVLAACATFADDARAQAADQELAAEEAQTAGAAASS